MTNALESNEDITSAEDPERIVDITRGLLTATGNLVQVVAVQVRMKQLFWSCFIRMYWLKVYFLPEIP